MDGLISSLIEFKDYLQTNKPDVVCITETKLKDEIKVQFVKEGYDTWRRDRKGKGGGGVMILVKQNITVDKVEYGDGMAETISVAIKSKGSNKKRKIVVTYVPPRTNAWEINEYKQMQQETINSITAMIKTDNKVLLLGDFNCKEVNWEEIELDEGAGAWGEELLQTMMVNTMNQWVRQAT